MKVFWAGIDFLAGQHKAKNVIGCKFPKNEKLLLALKNKFPHPFDLEL
ncbi:hypothetical protein [Aquirufa sp. OSTEICH-129A]